MPVTPSREGDMTGGQSNRVFDYFFVNARSHPDGEDDEKDGEDGRGNREGGPAWISPDVSPCQASLYAHVIPSVSGFSW